MNETLLQQILTQGFPTTRQEAWKYTDVHAIAAQPFLLAKTHEVDAAAIDPWRISDHCLVIINGYWAKALSTLPNTVQVKEIKNQTINSPTNDIFQQLNGAFSQQPLQMTISAGEKLLQPLQIIYFATEATWVQPRVEIHVEHDAAVTIYETFTSQVAAVINAVTQIYLQPNVTAEYIKWQQEAASGLHVGRTFITLEKNAKIRTHYYATGSSLTRSELNLHLQGEHARAELYGLYVGSARQHLDQQTFVDHAVPYTQSEEHYRGILQDKARAVFNGKVLVRPDAHHTEAAQANHNLLLSSDAEIDTKPELEIYHDEIKCTHGATIGQLDDDALFYLRTRGLTPLVARQLLLQGFVEKILEKLPDETIAQQLRHALSEKYL